MVNEAMLPRTAVREVEQRLTAAGCPDADFDARELFRLATGRDVRLSDRPLTAEQAAALEALCTRRAAREPLQYLCGSWSFLDFELAVGRECEYKDQASDYSSSSLSTLINAFCGISTFPTIRMRHQAL